MQRQPDQITTPALGQRGAITQPGWCPAAASAMPRRSLRGVPAGELDIKADRFTIWADVNGVVAVIMGDGVNRRAPSRKVTYMLSVAASYRMGCAVMA
jgi:hypothetical protein